MPWENLQCPAWNVVLGARLPQKENRNKVFSSGFRRLVCAVGAEELSGSQFFCVPQTPRAAPPLPMATRAVSLVPSQPKRRICIRKPLQICGLLVGKHNGGTRRDLLWVQLPTHPSWDHPESFCQAKPFIALCLHSPQAKWGGKFHPFALLLKTSWK